MQPLQIMDFGQLDSIHPQYSHKKTWAVTRPRLIDYRPITQD
jgi:hypothetical protein